MQNIIQTNTKKRTQYVDITHSVDEIVTNSDIKEGIALIYTKHTTTGVTINENESGLIEDMKAILKKLVPKHSYQHDAIDNNADSHLRSMIIGQQVMIPIKNKKLELGTWQRIFFVELDGPRNRKIIVKLVKG